MSNVVPVKIYTEFKHAESLPAYETLGAAGMDVRANETVKLHPKETKLIKTGIFMEVPLGYEIQVRPRSGLSLKTDLRVANAPGTIDSDYRGELCVIMTNINGSKEFVVSVGDRIAQIVLQKVPVIQWDVVPSRDCFSSTDRGADGMGSTGVK